VGYADNFEKACPLDSLSWVSMHPAARVCRLAALFLRAEHELKNLKEKGDWYVTAGVVRPWLLSVYEPPRGQSAGLIDAVMKDIARQREIRRKRAENRPWKEKETPIAERRNIVAGSLYRIIQKDNEGKVTKLRPTCRTITTISGILMALDVSGDANIRVYMRHRETGRVKVVITDVRTNYSGDDKMTLTKVLLKMAPVAVERALFSGMRIAVDFDRNGFLIDGEFHAYRHIARIIEGPKRALRTPRRVDKQGETEED
jgi:hypothetical protein